VEIEVADSSSAVLGVLPWRTLPRSYYTVFHCASQPLFRKRYKSAKSGVCSNANKQFPVSNRNLTFPESARKFNGCSRQSVHESVGHAFVPTTRLQWMITPWEKPKVWSRKRAAKFGSNRDSQARSATDRQLAALTLHKLSIQATRGFSQKLTLARDHLQSSSRRRSNYCTCTLNALGKFSLMHRNGTYITLLIKLSVRSRISICTFRSCFMRSLCGQLTEANGSRDVWKNPFEKKSELIEIYRSTVTVAAISIVFRCIYTYIHHRCAQSYSREWSTEKIAKRCFFFLSVFFFFAARVFCGHIAGDRL
jgi:hypothetical protein